MKWKYSDFLGENSKLRPAQKYDAQYRNRSHDQARNSSNSSDSSLTVRLLYTRPPSHVLQAPGPAPPRLDVYDTDDEPVKEGVEAIPTEKFLEVPLSTSYLLNFFIWIVLGILFTPLLSRPSDSPLTATIPNGSSPATPHAMLVSSFSSRPSIAPPSTLLGRFSSRSQIYGTSSLRRLTSPWSACL